MHRQHHTNATGQAQGPDLRRLRFPAALEAEFARDYYAKILPWIRNGLALLLALVALFWIRDFGSTGDAPFATYTIPAGLMVVLLLLTWHRRTVSYWQPMICLLGSIICLVT